MQLSIWYGRCCCFYVSTSENNLNYTDAHDVDEDMPAIIRRGGDWGDSINAGLTQQSAYNTPSTSVPTVASKK